MSNDFSHIPDFFREKVEKLFDINRQYSETYLKQLPALEQYKKRHPTQIVIFKCSDGRLLFSRYAQMPLGFLETFRNLGGKFNWGWIGLKESFKSLQRDGYVEYLERKSFQQSEDFLQLQVERQIFLDSLHVSAQLHSGADVDLHLKSEVEFATLVICTYHESRGNNAVRGCKALEFDIEQGIKNAKGFRMSIEKAYQGSRHKVFAIVFGMETDYEFFVLHGEKGQKRYLETYAEDVSDGKLFELICELYPSMPLQMKLDLLPVLRGNIRHGNEIRRANRPNEEMTHGEWILGICKSEPAESITVPNTAVLVGLLNPVLSKVIKTGLDVVIPNAEKGVILFTAACHDEDETESSARQEAKYYSRQGREVAAKHCPDMVRFMYPLPLLVDRKTKLFKLIESRKKAN